MDINEVMLYLLGKLSDGVLAGGGKDIWKRLKSLLQRLVCKLLRRKPPAPEAEDDFRSIAGDMGRRQTNPPDQAPRDIETFTARKCELEAIKQDLTHQDGAPALCILTGMGGVGKSALATRAAHQLKGNFPDGTLWADLGTEGHVDVAREFAKALGDGDEMPGSPEGVQRRYRTALQGKRVLIGLDNAQSSAQVEYLLPNSAPAAAVVTSREDMPSLAQYGAVARKVGVFSPPEALALLRQHVGDRADDERDAAEEICRLVGFLPLGLNICGASWGTGRWPTLRAVAERLRQEDSRLDRLKLGDDGAQDVRAVLEVSLTTLRPELSKLFCLLGLLGRGDFGSTKVVPLLGSSKDEAIEALGELVSLSLLQPSNKGGYCLHDLLYLLAKERLQREVPKPERDAVRRRLGRVTKAQAEATQLRECGDSFRTRGMLSEAVEEYRRALEVSEKIDDRQGRAGTLFNLALVYGDQGEFDKAIGAYAEAYKLSEQAGDQSVPEISWVILAVVWDRLDETVSMDIATWERMQRMTHEIGDTRAELVAWRWLGSFHMERQEWCEASEAYQQIEALAQKVDDHEAQLASFVGLASVCAEQGRPHDAMAHMERFVQLLDPVEDRNVLCRLLMLLAKLQYSLGEFDKARESVREAVEVAPSDLLDEAQKLQRRLRRRPGKLSLLIRILRTRPF
ncbi:MAG: tetratricopeptide repeat protein [Armatimonadia bacterium]